MKTLHANKTYLELAGQGLASICDSFSVGGTERQRLMSMLWLMGSPWGDRRIGERPRILSDITDDHTPFEFSLAFHEGRPELRMLMEALPSDPLVQSRWEAGLDLNQRLARQFGCSLDRFHAIEDLFRPTDEWAKFAIWHAVNVGDKPTFKIYLNPNAHGPEQSTALVRAALQRLGMPHVFDGLPEARPRRDRLSYLSLDLSDDDDARVKLYFCHHDATIADVEGFMELSRYHVSGEAAEFCRTASGGATRYEGLPIQTCYAFVGDDPCPDTVTLHFPVRSYADDDRVAMERISTLLPAAVRAPYQRMVGAFVGHDLEASQGAQTYVSYRNHRGQQRTTVYLSPNAYRAAYRSVRPSASRVEHVGAPALSLSA
jgi:DMATS type aromatic prenyltransferase